MDTSIIVVIAIVVVFAVAVPAMIRKSATELSRAEIDTVPDHAAVVPAEAPNPGHDHSERAQVFGDKHRKTPSVPTPKVVPVTNAPTLSLSASTPELAVIDGHGQTPTSTEVAEHSQLSVLPVAVGESYTAFADGTGLAGGTQLANGNGPANGVAGSGSASNVHMLHPAVHAVFNNSTHGPGQQTTGQPSHPPHQNATSEPGTAHRPVVVGGARRHERAHTGRGGRLGEGEPNRTENGPQISHPSIGIDEEHAMTEQATTLRESLRSLNTMVKGFAVVFLASVLGILVTSVLAIASVVHIALAGVFFGLAVVSLFIVRALNLRKREVKKQLRTMRPRAKADAAAKGGAAPKAGAPAEAPGKTEPAKAGAAPKAKPESRPVYENAAPVRPTRTDSAPSRTATAPTSSGTAARIAAAAQGASGSAKAAQARAAMARSAEAKKAREEADTGEIPLVRIRKEATEGHTTRQVLLTGPIPVVKENTSAEAGADSDHDVESRTTEARPVVKAAESSSARSADAQPATENVAGESPATEKLVADKPLSLGADLVAGTEKADDSAGQSGADAGVHAALDAAAPKVDDPFMQRLKSRDGWSPTPLPVPSYVDAPEAEHSVPSATAADASSYETEARSREDIAAQFAAELGYRPELSDSAREDGPLEHGRKAIRTTKGADLGAVNDVLARRRA